MNSVPMIQVAMDYIALPPALAMAQLVHKKVEAIEIGTPLCKAEGMRAVSAMRELCPDNIILADIKSPDVGGLEAKMAFDAGADWMTVMGAAPIDTIKLALAEANSRPGKEMIVELTGIRDILARAREWRSIGVDRMVYHRGWDEGNISRTWDANDRAIIQELVRMGFRVSVAGGIELDMVPFFRGIDISVFIIGRAIRETPDPAASAQRFRAAINQYWGAGVTSSGFEEQAAKAVRWAISEMGLLLMVDGRECPGCDSPGRFCHGERIEIQSPNGLNEQALVERIATALGASSEQARSTGPGQVVGWTQPGTFYLDLGGLPQLNAGTVLGLLSATGSALNALGCALSIDSALNVARRILRKGT